uniref:Antho-RPAMIDE=NEUROPEPTIDE n=1 Tax=Anthopleura elegantissima TaxID=6110 RepID=Q9TWV0_ANTEL|nr:Antho-RPamide=neuropeptide [Anthopleura elegantissima=sea anemone, Peptide, 9 aa] [Anthopleura elegantissima]
LPPGPLPRP